MFFCAVCWWDFQCCSCCIMYPTTQCTICFRVPTFNPWTNQTILHIFTSIFCFISTFHHMGVSKNRGYPQNTPKLSFLVGKPMVVGYHYFRKHPYPRHAISSGKGLVLDCKDFKISATSSPTMSGRCAKVWPTFTKTGPNFWRLPFKNSPPEFVGKKTGPIFYSCWKKRVYRGWNHLKNPIQLY